MESTKIELSLLSSYGENEKGFVGDGRKPPNASMETPFSRKPANFDVPPSPGTRYDDRGPHREMAIDCPAAFVGAKKEPPRYPRPLSIIQNSPATGTPTQGKTTFSTLPRTQDQRSGRKAVVEEEEEKEGERDRIRRYQEDLAKRREVEERQRREQEFLRTSLRGSKKLQELEERKVKAVHGTGFVNPSYLVEEEELGHQQLQLPKSFDVDDMVATIEEAKTAVHCPVSDNDLEFVKAFLLSNKFQDLVQVHNRVVASSLVGGGTSLADAVCVLPLHREIVRVLDDRLSAASAKELFYLLTKPYFKNFLLAHDLCLQQRKESVTTATASLGHVDQAQMYDEYLYENASQYGEDSIKIVKIHKTAEPLGATVRSDGESIIIGRIVKGGIADKSGLLHEGDEILEINGTDVRGRSINEISDTLSCLTGVLTFLINPSPTQRIHQHTEQPIMHVRAHFSYDPEDDHYIPCRELGMSFVKGDILHIINQDDPNWWQAYREGEDDQFLAGLVPSKAFHEQRESLKQEIVRSSKENSKKKRKCNCTQKQNQKKKLQNSLQEAEMESILSYEEVALYYPQPNRKRPIALIGPPNIGRQELRQRLMESHPDRFAAAIPHTSRPKTETEIDGREYYFLPRNVFEQDIEENKFVEYGEYEKHLFGTSMKSIREVVNSGKTCILNFHPQSLRILKASDLKPYFVFVAPPNIEKLKQLRQKQCVKVTDDELKVIIEKARRMEEDYGHYFDMIVVNQDFDRSYEELLAEVNRLELEPQWVPLQWMLSAS